VRYFSYITLMSFLLSATAGAATLCLEVRHLWEGKPISLSDDIFTTRAGEALQFTRLAYLLSEPSVTAVKNQRRLKKTDWVAYVDARNETSLLSISDLPSGHYRQIEFFIGLNPETDQSDPTQYGSSHPLNPLLNNLYWDPQGGYIYLALEGRETRGLGFSYHLGGTGNRVRCQLPVEIDVSEESIIAIDFHLDRLFNQGKPWVTQQQTSTHSRDRDSVATLMAERLANVFTVREIRQKTRSNPTLTNNVANFIGTPYAFRVKKGFPVPNLPADYPLTNERIALGSALFHDVRLSGNETISCASCHESAKAFSDTNRVSVGANGNAGRRNAMPLLNLAWKDSFFWDGRAKSLRKQVVMPIKDHLEMDASIEEVAAGLSEDKAYLRLFDLAFGSPKVSQERIAVAIEQFILSLTSYDSKFDRARLGQDTLTEKEQLGFELFMTEFDPRRGLRGADCFHCHSGPFFSTHQFQNNGLPSPGDTGLMGVTGSEADRGKFVTPSLRNVALTAPYMHDGRFETLEEVVEHYSSGIERSKTLDPNLSKHPGSGIPLTSADKTALVAFLKTLTDERFSNSLR
jgi:cytochrome c peroxidase